MSIASIITIGRIIGAFLLLLTTPSSLTFLIIYSLCCISDVLDGYIARKTKTTSKLGEILDSIADFVLIVVIFIIFIPLFEWRIWMLYWGILIALIRFGSLTIGYIKYRTVSFLHTYANKGTGVMLALFPIWYLLFRFDIAVLILCIISTISAFEEVIIIIRSKELDRNTRGMFFNS
jgi:CDP-diacylglycerol--glycerol-3-phosphate 3-phosphatidyltransferase